MSDRDRAGAAGSTAKKVFDLTADDEEATSSNSRATSPAPTTATSNTSSHNVETISEAERLAVEALANLRNVKLYGRLIPVALQFMESLSRTAAGDSSGSGPDSVPEHAFCYRCPGGEHPELQAAMIRIFSFKDKDQISKWKQMIFHSILICKDCYVAYSKAKDELRSA